VQVAPGLVGPAGLRTAHRDELAPFQSTQLHRAPASQGSRLQDTKLVRISQAGMLDISQRASWCTLQNRTPQWVIHVIPAVPACPVCSESGASFGPPGRFGPRAGLVTPRQTFVRRRQSHQRFP
jgi:hypothetical protein